MATKRKKSFEELQEATNQELLAASRTILGINAALQSRVAELARENDILHQELIEIKWQYATLERLQWSDMMENAQLKEDNELYWKAHDIEDHVHCDDHWQDVNKPEWRCKDCRSHNLQKRYK